MNLSDIGIIVERKFKEFKKKGSKRKASFSPPIEDALPKKIKTPDLRNTSKTIEDSLVEDKHDFEEHKKSLPIFTVKKKLIKRMKEEGRLVVIGETGSGKTTQIPQYIFNEILDGKGKIAITQPRRVAAISVAERVALEMNSSIGKEVGYCVRFEECYSQTTKILYMTDGMLMRHATLNRLLTQYSYVIIDEAHERTVHTDVLLSIIKKAQKERLRRHMQELKIVVMSATMDVGKLSEYFDKCPILYIEGRLHPISIKFTEEKIDDYVFACLTTVMQIHMKAPPQHDVLVFLTGQDEIENFVRSLRQMGKNCKSNIDLIVLPMYAALPFAQQKRVFEDTPNSTRKVIVATNIAETSITIRGIKYVIDSGMVKAKLHKPSSGLDLLTVVRISQSQAWQRSGRAGRQSAGTCYRVYDKETFDSMPINSIPEILRSNIASVTLQLVALGVKNTLTFDFVDKPSEESLNSAVDQLTWLGAIEKDKGDELHLTEIGKRMAAFPLDPRLSRMLLAAERNGCLEEMLTVVSMLSSDSVLLISADQREKAEAVRRKFQSVEGDHITLLNVFKSYKGSKKNKVWCKENFINHRNMKIVIQIRKQLREICIGQNMTIKSCGEDRSLVRKSFVYGFFMNAAQLHSDGLYSTIIDRKMVNIHPSSVLFRSKPGYVLYSELVQTNKCYIRNLSLIDPQWLFEISPEFVSKRLIRQ